MKYEVGQWVEVTRRRLDGPDLVQVGKVVEATRDYAVAECRTREGTARHTMSEDTASIVSFRRMTAADWQKRRR